ncbi:uncharacterized protein LOC135467067 [Liolophura sinensis]|uniref:uncharacterized protein LOC135467067 n=1 Tax=Liolophura sinensis TaxID=3198878 RepID=UPI0031595FCF
MSQPISLTLPALPRYSGVPKRYEETRPVLIQDFSHKRILGRSFALGHEIHRKLHEEAEEEKQKAIRTTEEMVWLEAKAVAEQDLQRVLEEAKLEQDRVVKKIHESARSCNQGAGEEDAQEALRVEMAMQKSALEQVRIEREEGARRMKEVLAQMEAEIVQKREEAVKAAREEEQRIAAREIARITRIHNEELKRVKDEAEAVLKETKEEISEVQEKAVKEAVQETIKQENLKHTADLASAIVSYDIELAKMRIELDIQLNEINRLLARVEDRERAKERIKEELKRTRQSFQDYITRVGKFTEGHAAFMLNPMVESVVDLSES